MTYINAHPELFCTEEWAIPFAKMPFPRYWRVVYSIATKLPRFTRVVEIGAGFGFITSIFKHLGYSVVGYERNKRICAIANRMLDYLFPGGSCIIPATFHSQLVNSEVLVLVNCVYWDKCCNKAEYMKTLEGYYVNTGFPKYYLLEVIDATYQCHDDVFPNFVRLSREDIVDMFPHTQISSWETYRYPNNAKSKTLYLIERL